jgi:hypothetical protein
MHSLINNVFTPSETLVILLIASHLWLANSKDNNPWYRPTACHERSYALEPSCPLAGACFQELPCPSVYAGKFNHQSIPSCIHRDPHDTPLKNLALWSGGTITPGVAFEHDIEYYDAKHCNDTRTMKGDRGYFRQGRWTDRKLNRTREIEMGIVREYCEYHWFCPEEMYSALENYVLIFIGDSILRQMFNRLIWHHRGLQEIIEHYYHQVMSSSH